jgi:serine phosphatase RsbU (regulator of sigma subunit)
MRTVRTAAAEPRDDAQRLAALRSTGLLDAVPSASFDRLTRLASELLGVPVALVSFVDAERQFFASCVGLPPDVTAARETPLSHSFCAHVVARGEALIVPDAREHPLLHDNPAVAELGVVAYLGIPIRHPDGTVLGSFCAIDGKPRAWNQRDVDLMRDLAASVDTEIALHVTVEAERAARREAEESGRRLRLLAEASIGFADSLDQRSTIDAFARVAVPALADWCAVDLLEDGRVQRLALVHRDGDEAARRTLGRYPPRLDADAGSAPVLRSGVPQLIERIDDRYLDRIAQDGRHRSALESLGAGSAAIVPLSARGRVLGCATFVSGEAGRYGADDLPLLLELAHRAALAIDNARLYQSAHRIARTLQESLLPPNLPEVAGLDLARHYRAAGAGTEVGGDFYDVVETPDGRVLAAIGDVMGKGPAAAAVTGLARHTLRASALRERIPSDVLATLNDVLLGHEPADGADLVFATVCAASLRLHEGGATVVVANGGHPPPLVRRADGAIEPIEVPGTALGLVAGNVLEDRTVHLEPGDTLLLYTDGVTEARRADGSFLDGEGLHDLVADAPADSAAALVAAIGAEVESYQHGSARDDVALLAVRVTDAR